MQMDAWLCASRRRARCRVLAGRPGRSLRGTRWSGRLAGTQKTVGSTPTAARMAKTRPAGDQLRPQLWRKSHVSGGRGRHGSNWFHRRDLLRPPRDDPRSKTASCVSSITGSGSTTSKLSSTWRIPSAPTKTCDSGSHRLLVVPRRLRGAPSRHARSARARRLGGHRCPRASAAAPRTPQVLGRARDRSAMGARPRHHARAHLRGRLSLESTPVSRRQAGPQIRAHEGTQAGRGRQGQRPPDQGRRPERDRHVQAKDPQAAQAGPRPQSCL